MAKKRKNYSETRVVTYLPEEPENIKEIFIAWCAKKSIRKCEGLNEIIKKHFKDFPEEEKKELRKYFATLTMDEKKYTFKK